MVAPISDGVWPPAVIEAESLAVAREITAPRTPVERPSGPLLRCAESVHDWGTIAPGEELKHSFAIYNDGSSTLKLYRVKASCGCAATEFDREIAPGEEGQVTVVINTDKLRTGKARAIFRLLSNNPEDSEVWLILQGAIQEIELTNSAPQETGSESVRATPQDS